MCESNTVHLHTYDTHAEICSTFLCSQWSLCVIDCNLFGTIMIIVHVVCLALMHTMAIVVCERLSIVCVVCIVSIFCHDPCKMHS